MSDDSPNPRVAERLARAARAAQALSETLWEALNEELVDPSTQRIAELAERLSEVPATVALLARCDSHGQGPSSHGQGHSSHGQGHSSSHGQDPSSIAVLVDDLVPAGPAGEVPLAPSAPPGQALPEIEIRDERGEEASLEPRHNERVPAAWIGAIERRLERYERDRMEFAVLLIELADVGRLRHAELPGEVSRLTGLVEAALASALRPADTLTRESPGRYWLLAPETDSEGAGLLAERLASAVSRAASHRGAPLAVAVGVAMCPKDGRESAALAAHANVGLYAARAEGRPVTQ